MSEFMSNASRRLGLFFFLFLVLMVLNNPCWAASYAYIANNGADTMTKVPMSGGTVAVGDRPRGLAVTPDGKYILVTNSHATSVSRIVVSTCTVDATINTPYDSSYLALSPDGEYVYVANQLASTVSRINVGTAVVDQNITVGNFPNGLAVTPDGNYVYVANNKDGTVSRIDTSTASVDQTINTGHPIIESEGVAVTPDGKYVYVAMNGRASVFRIDTATGVADSEISVGSFSFGVSVSPDGKYVYVANLGDNTVSRINVSTNAVDATISVGDTPRGVAVSPDGKYVYVANWGDNTVSRINASTNTADKAINVGDAPWGVALTPDGRYLVVSNSGDDTVSIIDLVVSTTAVGTGPLGVAAGPNGKYVWVSNNGTNTVSKMNVQTDAVEATITVGNNPYGLAVTPDNKYVFVANSTDDTVSRIDVSTNAVDHTFSVGDDPRGVSVTADGEYVIVANYGDNSITRIAVALSSTMSEHADLSQPISLGNFITPEVQSGTGDEDDEGDEEEDTRPPGGPAHQIGGGGNNMDPPIPPNYTWTGDEDNGTLQELTMPLVHTGVSGDGVSAEARVLDIQVPGLMFQQTDPAGTVQQTWLALGEAGTTPSGVEYSTSMRWNYDVRVIDVQMNWPQSVLRNMATGKHCLTYYLMTEDGRKSNCRVGYLDCSPDTGTASVTVDRDSGTKAPQAVEELAFKLQLSYFNEDTGLVDRVREGTCTVTTEEGTWGTYPITDGLCTFTIPFGKTSEIGFNSLTFNGTKTVRFEFRDGFMYAYDQDHRDADVGVYQCVDGESYAIEYYQDLVYICNQGQDPDGPILGRMYGK